MKTAPDLSHDPGKELPPAAAKTARIAAWKLGTKAERAKYREWVREKRATKGQPL